MYLRTISRRNKDGTVVRYLQLAHNVRNERGNAVAEVVHSFGREDELDRDALARLVRSMSRFLDPERALATSVGSELTFTGSRPYGGAYLLDALWRRLGIDRALAVAAAGRKVSAATERLIFTPPPPSGCAARRCAAPPRRSAPSSPRGAPARRGSGAGRRGGRSRGRD